LAHPKDCSVMTYRGHEVLRTLIRCHFSPLETTGSQYLYSGSHDGKIHVSDVFFLLYRVLLPRLICFLEIWSLDGRVVQILDRSKTLPISFDPSAPEPENRDSRSGRSRVCVRDVSWHSQVTREIVIYGPQTNM
jgi:DDB1- and CUL4-associated factor 11